MSSRHLEAWLHDRRLLVGDGGMGTMLQAAGLAPGGCPELWNSDRPDAVTEVARAYKKAGAELLETNSFGGSPHKLAAYGVAERCEELNAAAARLARKVAGEDALVVGSIGPTGALLEPYGPVPEEEAALGFERQARALAEGGADALCIETMIDIREAELALHAAAHTGLPLIATMTFESTSRGFFTVMGVDVATAASRLKAAGATVLGSNCGTGPTEMVDVLREYRQQTDAPLLVQPNAGLPQLSGGEVIYPLSAKDFGAFVPSLIEAGACIIGGCCGTTPGHVKAVQRAVESLRQTN